MKLVIDIPEDDYEFIKDLNAVMGGRVSCKTIQYNVINAIKNGTSLPKGHGRLIDVSDLLDAIELEDNDYNREENVGEIITLEDIDRIPTIIEADGGEEE